MAEKEKKELKNDYVKKGVELEPIMLSSDLRPEYEIYFHYGS